MGDVGDGAFDDFEEGLLHPFARDVAGDRDVGGGAVDLVDLVDVDDAHLGFGDVVVGGLEEAEDDVFDIFADIARLGQGGGVGDGEGNVEDGGQGFGNQGFPRACRAKQQHIGFAEFDFFFFAEGAGFACSGCRRRPRSSFWRSPAR